MQISLKQWHHNVTKGVLQYYNGFIIGDAALSNVTICQSKIGVFMTSQSFSAVSDSWLFVMLKVGGWP